MIPFLEVFRYAGVDQRHSPTGMIVPFGSSNVAALIDPGKRLKVDRHPHAIDVKEVDGTEILQKIAAFRDKLNEPNTDPQFKAAAMPNNLTSDARFFEFRGNKTPINFPGLEISARNGKRIEATLKVVVLKPQVIKIAIRNVMVPGSSGVPTCHASKPANQQDELLSMNRIWNSQTNIRFELVPSDWLVIDDSDPKTKQELANAFGMNDASLANFHNRVAVDKVANIFAKHKVPGAHITFFVVDQVISNEKHVNGRMMSSHGIAFIGSSRGWSTFAHEAGHFIGGRIDGKTKEWSGHPHTLERDRKTGKVDEAEDVRMLMRDGGAGWVIPFDLAQEFRGFFDRHPNF